MGDGIDRDVHMGHLTGGVHTGVRATGGARHHRRAEHGGERLVDHPGHRALTDLHGPAREIGAVVGYVEPQAY